MTPSIGTHDFRHLYSGRHVIILMDNEADKLEEMKEEMKEEEMKEEEMKEEMNTIH